MHAHATNSSTTPRSGSCSGPSGIRARSARERLEGRIRTTGTQVLPSFFEARRQPLGDCRTAGFGRWIRPLAPGGARAEEPQKCDPEHAEVERRGDDGHGEQERDRVGDAVTLGPTNPTEERFQDVSAIERQNGSEIGNAPADVDPQRLSHDVRGDRFVGGRGSARDHEHHRAERHSGKRSGQGDDDILAWAHARPLAPVGQAAHSPKLDSRTASIRSHRKRMAELVYQDRDEQDTNPTRHLRQIPGTRSIRCTQEHRDEPEHRLDAHGNAEKRKLHRFAPAIIIARREASTNPVRPWERLPCRSDSSR